MHFFVVVCGYYILQICRQNHITLVWEQRLGWRVKWWNHKTLFLHHRRRRRHHHQEELQNLLMKISIKSPRSSSIPTPKQWVMSSTFQWVGGKVIFYNSWGGVINPKQKEQWKEKVFSFAFCFFRIRKTKKLETVHWQCILTQSMVKSTKIRVPQKVIYLFTATYLPQFIGIFVHKVLSSCLLIRYNVLMNYK